MSVYDSMTARAALRVKDNLKQFGIDIEGAGVELSNVVLGAAEKHARTLTPVHKKKYPPSLNRAPGTMRRSIRVVDATRKHPGKIIIDTWLWEWIENWNARRAASGGKLKQNRRIGKKDKGIKRFSKMIKTDPRRLLGEPMEKQMNFIKSEKRLEKSIQKAIKKNAIPAAGEFDPAAGLGPDGLGNV